MLKMFAHTVLVSTRVLTGFFLIPVSGKLRDVFKI